MLQVTCTELGESNSLITDIAQKSVKERLAEVLLSLKATFGLDANNVLQIAVTRKELANMIGTATEMVIRLLAEFKSDGLVDFDGRKIKLIDIKGLVRIANVFD